MQQDETPQVNQLPPAVPGQTPPVPPQNPQQGQAPQGQSFYQPSPTPQYHDDTQPSPYEAPAHNSQPAAMVSWEASEYVHNAKGGGWLLGFGAVVAVALGFAIWFAAWTFAVLILVMALALGIFAFRPPHVVHYTLDENGIQVGGKTFHYSEFRAFGILQDGAFFTMDLIPIKRFAPAINIYFAEEQGEQIVDIVGQHLPMEDIKPDLIDTLMRRLRF